MEAAQWPAAHARRTGKTYEARRRAVGCLPLQARHSQQVPVEPGRRGPPAHLPLSRSQALPTAMDGRGWT